MCGPPLGCCGRRAQEHEPPECQGRPAGAAGETRVGFEAHETITKRSRNDRIQPLAAALHSHCATL
eukprot:5488338-Prymnesium_polylepis.1